MKHNVMLTITSLLSILFFTFHFANDIVRGFEPGGFKNLSGVLTLVVWLYGTLVLAERRSGYIIILLGSLLGLLMPRPHEGGGTYRRQDRQLQRNLLLGLDAHHARSDRALLRHPLSARTVEPAMAPAPVVQQPEHGKPSHRVVIGSDPVLPKLRPHWFVSFRKTR